jgi:hypothetical protein
LIPDIGSSHIEDLRENAKDSIKENWLPGGQTAFALPRRMKRSLAEG